MNAMLNELGRDLRSEKLIPALSCGTITGVQLLVFSVSMAAVIFSGPLNPFLAGGLGLVLFGYCALGTLVALASGFRGAVAGAPLPSVMMLVAITTTIDLEGRALYATSVAATDSSSSGTCDSPGSCGSSPTRWRGDSSPGREGSRAWWRSG